MFPIFLKKLLIDLSTFFTIFTDLHVFHKVQAFKVEFFSLLGNTEGAVTDTDVLVSVDNDLAITTIDSLLNLLEPLPELEGFKITL